LKFEFTAGIINMTAKSDITATNGNIEFTSFNFGDIYVESPIFWKADQDIHISRPVWINGNGETLIWGDHDSNNVGKIWCDKDAEITILSSEVKMLKIKSATIELAPKNDSSPGNFFNLKILEF
jgi:hypothetical protein